MTEIEKLREEIRIAQEAYYNLSPIMSDSDYDAKLEKLRTLDSDAPEISAVGAPVPGVSVWEKVRHEIPMGSLNKVNSWDGLLEWSRDVPADMWFMTHKIDGSSMELVYNGGKLIRAVTRGDGVIGEDVLENVRKIPNVPSSLGIDTTVTVRGEVVMMKRVFQEKYSQDYANPRNTAAGKVREKKNGGRDCENLHFLAYDALFENEMDEPLTLVVLFKWLSHHGFETPHVYAANSNINALKDMFDLEAKSREDLAYEIDGMVVSADTRKLLEELGSHNMRPRGQVAWKFDALQVETTVQDVRWQIGPTGRLCPVAVLEPVNIGGVVVTNVSLHNQKMFKQLRLFKGCRVRVSRRNDVIPFVEANLDFEES